MARLVDPNVRNNSANTYGRSSNTVQERPQIRTQVIKAYGRINSIGVCPDGSTCTTPTTPTEVEFTLDIYRRGNEFTGEVYIVNYDTRKKINSNQLIYYQDHGGAYTICIFCVMPNDGCCNYELIVNLTPCGCATNGAMWAYVAPIYNEGLNIGGPLIAGEVIFCDNCQRNMNVGPICNPLPYMDTAYVVEAMVAQPCVGPTIGNNAVAGGSDNGNAHNECGCHECHRG